ncbi:MAG TPA: Uma2 family endonuclease [Chloroflexota bacterium]|nr:Uma2 family endonuclease [Chloroflexota bacterium]
MAVGTRVVEFKMVRRADGSEIDLSPIQGMWTEEQYLALTNQTNNLIEFTDGTIEVLPMPTSSHQVILLLLYDLFRAIVARQGGKVLVAPLRLRVRPGKLREPDILMLLDAADPRYQDAYWLGADLVVEVVSPDGSRRDTEEKPLDYAEAGIPEYWIVNPLDDTITVLVLDGQAYRLHGRFRRGEHATSQLLPDFSVSVDEVFDAT